MTVVGIEDMSPRMTSFLANPPKRISVAAIKKRKSRTARRYQKNWLPSLIRQQGGRCYYCRVPIVAADIARDRRRLATLDHYIALANGGKNCRENLVAACCDCNHAKGDRDPIEFAIAMEARQGRDAKQLDSEAATARAERHRPGRPGHSSMTLTWPEGR
jgi:5-methylcytosine-specific restriction endonuclease McrA